MVKANTRSPKAQTLEVRHDHWERFEAAVDIAVKTPAIHREAKKRTPRKGRVHKANPRI